MDFKVRCIDNRGNKPNYTIGKTYHVVDGALTDDHGFIFKDWGKTFEDWVRFSASKFELVEEKKMFTKADLKNGDVIKRRNGWVEIVCLETGTLIARSGFNEIKDIKDDLTDACGTEYDIVAVRRPKRPCECKFCAFDEEYGDLVYDRERDTVREMTVAEIEKALGYTVKIVK